MDRTLSAAATSLLKFVFTPVWILGFGWGTYSLWAHPETVEFNGVVGAATRSDQWLFIFAFILGTAMVLYFAIPLKRVVLTSNGLKVSNYRDEALIPFSAIEGVHQSHWLRPRAVTVHLRSDMAFGGQFIFLPAARNRLLFWQDDEVVAELRHLANIGLPEST
jgi:hypothetical protein